MTNDARTLADVGEFGLISEFVSDLHQGSHVVVGPGDDGAVLNVSGQLVVSTDALIEGVHFRRDWSTAEDIGRKCVAVNVADIEAMGAIPTSMVVAFSAPSTLELEWVEQWWRGVVSEAERAGVSVVGGDVTSARDISIAVTCFGHTDGGPHVTRGGARSGDVIAMRGQLGWSAAGLAILNRGFRSPRVLVDAHRVPSVPYGQGRVAALSGATSMIDISDGLIADLAHIAQQSSVSMSIDADRLPIPEQMHAVAAATGAEARLFVLTGGEDHALVATFPSAEQIPAGWTRIGDVVVARDAHVWVDSTPWTDGGGWDHFG